VHIKLKGGEVFAFAGLWLPGKAGNPPTAAIVTTSANELVHPIHTRMPVILQPEGEQLWLDPEVTAPELVLPLLRPYPADLMEAWVLEGTADVREFDQDPVLAARALRLAEAPTGADVG
jgi:putative SOS response-associated peptidase YedK